MIKISVIIPVYNNSKFLRKCIESVRNQNLKEIEIICINDGSTDNSLEILQEFQAKDKRIIIIDKKNEGVSIARNVGIEIAKGKYCLNIDSDDWVEQNYFKELYKRAEKDNLDITISDIIFDFTKDYQKNYILRDLKIDDVKVISNMEYIEKFLKNNFFGYTCNKLIKRELYNNVKYKKEISVYEDVDIILRIAYYSKKIGKLNKAFYHYVQHSNSAIHKLDYNKSKQIQIVFDNLNLFFKDFNYYKQLLKLRKTLILLSCLDKIDKLNKKAMEVQMISDIKKIKLKNLFFLEKNNLYLFELFLLKIVPFVLILKIIDFINIILKKLLKKGSKIK